jgi:hypothetical protein
MPNPSLTLFIVPPIPLNGTTTYFQITVEPNQTILTLSEKVCDYYQKYFEEKHISKYDFENAKVDSIFYNFREKGTHLKFIYNGNPLNLNEDTFNGNIENESKIYMLFRAGCAHKNAI